MSADALQKSKSDLQDYLRQSQGAGRKSDKTVTLATVQFGREIGDDDRSEDPQKDYAKYFKERSKTTKYPKIRPYPEGEEKPEKGWNYRKIDDSTIASPHPDQSPEKVLQPNENIVQLTDILEDSFVSLGRAHDRKVTVRKQADPLGQKPKHKGPKYTVGDATPERFVKAKAAGKQLRKEQETFEDGRPTGLERKRFIGFLEVWHSRNVIDKVTFAAAQEFQRDCDLALEASPRMISRYGHIMPSGVPDLLPQEIQIEFEKRKHAAIKVVDPRLRLILGWIAEVSNADAHPDEVAEQYWPHLSEKTRIERFKGLLEYTCMTLSVHYGLQTRHRWVKLSLSKAAAEINDLLGP
jgi:hypothetical protein